MKRLKNWSYLIAFIAFIIASSGLEYGGENIAFWSLLAFIVLIIIALILYGKAFSMELENDFNPREKDPLEFTIKYKSPLFKEDKIIKSSNQVKIRNIIEKLAKKEIDYDIQVKIKEA